jgi:hypothetical protein
MPRCTCHCADCERSGRPSCFADIAAFDMHLLGEDDEAGNRWVMHVPADRVAGLRGYAGRCPLSGPRERAATVYALPARRRRGSAPSWRVVRGGRE